ncbi:MAG: hypothetical protein GX100_03895 [candidate division WS1 bacterium]|jgi:predicted transcriptional regulator|nr:hypothetical protein [candidate division WS1 bacterium]
MDSRVEEFVRDVAHNVVGLDVALFFQANPGIFDTAAGLALRLHHKADDIQRALDRLAEHGLVEIAQRGEGQYLVYSLCHNAEVWRLLCLLSEAYLDNAETRKEIVRMLVHQQVEDSSQQETDRS